MGHFRTEQREEFVQYVCGKKTLYSTHLVMGNNLAGSMDGRLESAPDSRREERLERASESRREALRFGGGGAMMSSRLCTGEEIDLKVVRERWRRMRKGGERARKGVEMEGWDEDELVGNLRMINGREKR